MMERNVNGRPYVMVPKDIWEHIMVVIDENYNWSEMR